MNRRTFVKYLGAGALGTGIGALIPARKVVKKVCPTVWRSKLWSAPQGKISFTPLADKYAFSHAVQKQKLSEWDFNKELIVDGRGRSSQGRTHE